MCFWTYWRPHDESSTNTCDVCLHWINYIWTIQEQCHTTWILYMQYIYIHTYKATISSIWLKWYHFTQDPQSFLHKKKASRDHNRPANVILRSSTSPRFRATSGNEWFGGRFPDRRTGNLVFFPPGNGAGFNCCAFLFKPRKKKKHGPVTVWHGFEWNMKLTTIWLTKRRCETDIHPKKRS